MKDINKKYNKFYTKKEVAEKCLNILTEYYPNIYKEHYFLEPSAGSGNFSLLLPNCLAYDIYPEHSSIKKADFLNEVILDKKEYITIGNPPFGKRCKLAIDFFNKCSQNSILVGMVLPITFQKYNIQKELNPDFKLIHSSKLDNNSFLFNEKEYNVNCVFQIWVLKNSELDNYEDIRKYKKPSTKLADCLLWQHNATKESRAYIEEDWKYCVYRQGYKDYSKLFTKENDYDFIKDRIYNSSDQFFYMKPLNIQADKIITSLDFFELANMNMSTPGFGKADFVEYFLEKKSTLK